MAAYKTRAISIKTQPFAESDKMVTLFSREHGKIRILAKGARRIPSRLAGRVEVFSCIDCFIAKCRSIDILSQCEMVETFQKIREHPDKLPAGLYILKLVAAGTAEGQRYPELFDLLLKTLYALKAGEDGKKVAKQFEKDFVMIEGIYQKDLDPQYILSGHLERDIREW